MRSDFTDDVGNFTDVKTVYVKWVSWISQFNVVVLSKKEHLLKNIQQILQWVTTRWNIYVQKLGG